MAFAAADAASGTIDITVGFLGSWYATYEDAPVWNNRKPQEPDNYSHQTDKALADFRAWFEGFAYESKQPELKKLRRTA